MADADAVLLKPHPAGDLFRRPARLERILDRCLHLRMGDQLSMNRAAALVDPVADGLSGAIRTSMTSRLDEPGAPDLQALGLPAGMDLSALQQQLAPFVDTMASLAERGISPAVVDDQVGRLTFTEDLAAATDHLLRTGAPFGTYNCTSSGESRSWAAIAADSPCGRARTTTS